MRNYETESSGAISHLADGSHILDTVENVAHPCVRAHRLEDAPDVQAGGNAPEATSAT